MVEVLEALDLPHERAELTMVPLNTTQVPDELAGKLLGLLDELDGLDDVQKVYANFDISDEALEFVELARSWRMPVPYNSCTETPMRGAAMADNGFKWHPIEDLPTDWGSLSDPESPSFGPPLVGAEGPHGQRGSPRAVQRAAASRMGNRDWYH